MAKRPKVTVDDFSYDDEAELQPLEIIAKASRKNDEINEQQPKSSISLNIPKKAYKPLKAFIKSKKVLKVPQASSDTLSNTQNTSSLLKVPQTSSDALSNTQGPSKGPQSPSSLGDILVLHFFVQSELNDGVKLYQYREIGEELCRPAKGIECAVYRLTTKGFLERLTGKNCGSGHGFVVKVTDAGKELWRKNEQLAWIAAKSKKVLKVPQSPSIDKIRSDKNLILSDQGWWELGWEKIPGVTEQEVHKLVAEIISINETREPGRLIKPETVKESIDIFALRCSDDKELAKMRSPVAVFKKELLSSYNGSISAKGDILVALKSKRRIENMRASLTEDQQSAIVAKMRALPGWDKVDEELCIFSHIEQFGLEI